MAGRPFVEHIDPGMSYRGGWIFVSSPGTVTPFHIDHEHNFILQIRGNYTWDPMDRGGIGERAQELFHDRHSREEIRWDGSFCTKATYTEGRAGLLRAVGRGARQQGRLETVSVLF